MFVITRFRHRLNWAALRTRQAVNQSVIMNFYGASWVYTMWATELNNVKYM